MTQQGPGRAIVLEGVPTNGTRATQTPPASAGRRGPLSLVMLPETPVGTIGHASLGAFWELMEGAPLASFAKDADGRYVYASPYLLSLMGKYMGSDWRGKTDADYWPAEAAELIHKYDEAVMSGAGPQVFSRVMPAADGRHTVMLIEFPLVDADMRIGVGGLAVDVTEYANSQTDHAQLLAVADHTAESVVMTGVDGRITYVNPAFERVTGYSRDEVLGLNPRFQDSGLQSDAFYEQVWSMLRAGQTWTGEFTNRRKDGSFFIETAVVAPIAGPDGGIAGIVAVKRDVTDERALSAGSAAAGSEHALVLQVVRDLRPGETAEAVAREICLKVASLSGVAAAQIVAFQLDGLALPISHVVIGRPDPPLRPLSYQVGQMLRRRAVRGPWIEPWANRQGRAYDRLLDKAGPSALAYAPVYYDERLIGLLVVESVDVTNKNAVAGLLPTITEFAYLAGAVLGVELSARIDMQVGRKRVANIIANRAFMPVFQPIVDMFLDKVVGYEALTRFTDGSSPQAVFAEATAVHLGVELEVATIKAALAASMALPAEVWLNLNASPDLILAGGQLRRLLSGVRRPIVIEVTEHSVVVDYPVFRDAVAALKPGTRLAVDDAGAGFASLRHILELRPDFVKLDRWLVAGLETDKARQAMIVGLRYFARTTGCQLIAEGIESERELAVLRSLDIHLGQGYALGRPRALAENQVAAAVGG